MWDLHGPSSDIQQVHIQKCWNTDSSQSRWFGSFVTCNIWFKHCAAEFIHSDTITDLFCIFFNNSKLTLRFTWSFDGNMMNVWQFNNWIIARYWSYLMFYTERNIKTDDFFYACIIPSKGNNQLEKSFIHMFCVECGWAILTAARWRLRT